MKFTITVLEENKHIVLVKNENKQAFIYKPYIHLEAGEEQPFKTGIVKAIFGNWEEHSYKEQLRRKQNNSHLFTLKILTKRGQISTIGTKDEIEFEMKQKEPEFVDLVEEETEEKEEESICAEIKEDGSRCQIKVKKGERYCHWHKKKGE